MAYAVAGDCTRGTDFGQGLRAALRLAQEPPERVDGAQQDAISPELALVCPELRRLAIEALPDRDPDGFVPSRWQAELQTDRPHRAVAASTLVEPRRRTFQVTVAAAARIALEATKTAVFGVITIAAVTGLVTLATVLPGA